MRKFTIIVLLPDNVADQFGECCTVWQCADTPLEAQRKAQAEFAHVYDEDPDSFAIVAVFAGIHKDIKEDQ